MSWFNAIGNKGKIFAQDENGSLNVNIAKGNGSEIVIYSKDNLLAPRTAADFEPRSIDSKRYSFPHLWTPFIQEGYPKRSIRDIFDQTFIISSTLDSEVVVQFGVTEVVDGTHEIAQSFFYIDLGNIPTSNGTNVKTMTLTPEKSTETVSGTIVKELPELRQPYPAFYLNIKPITAPTVGEIKIMVCRRFQ